MLSPNTARISKLGSLATASTAVVVLLRLLLAVAFGVVAVALGEVTAAGPQVWAR